MNSVLGSRGLLFWDCKCYRSPMMEGHRVRGHRAAQWGWQAGRGGCGPGWALPTRDRPPCDSLQRPLWLGSLDSPAKTPPWPPGKPGETLLVSPTCSQGPQPGLLHGQLRGLRSRPGGVWGCGKGPPPRPPPAPWNSLSTAASLIPALPAGWLRPWSGAARRGRAGLGGLSHQEARWPQSPGQGG